MAGRRRRAYPPGYYRREAIWWLWVLLYVAHTASGLALAVWVFLTGHWIIGSLVAAWTIWWTVRLFDELGLTRFAKSFR